MNKFNQSHILSVLEALAYYDVFNFPLSFNELLTYSRFSDAQNLEQNLNYLLNQKVVFAVGEFYSLRNDLSLVETRKKDDLRAKEYTHQAYKKSALIAKFPYVKGVFISGSLSKGTMGDDGDIDYFIVTKPNRLWIARTLLIAYKKVFLLNSRKYFCINYLIDDETLEIEQKNRFTATELVTLLPMVNPKLYTELLHKNDWVQDYYPSESSKFLKPIETKSSLFQKMVEPILNTSMGDILDDFFMNITLKRWRSKFQNFSEEDFTVALRTTKRISKHHPSHFQKKVLKGFDERMATLKVKMNQVERSKLKQA